jgi:ribosomal protein L40E
VIGIPWFFIIVFIVMLVLISMASKGRRNADPANTRRCSACGATHPAVAQFCRKCGKPL